MKLDHINLVVELKKLEKIKRFYCEVLGFVDGERPKVSIKGHWLYSEGHAVLHIQETNKNVNSKSTGHIDHIAFVVSGLANFLAHFDELEIEYTTHYFEPLDLTQVFIVDPLGVTIELNFHGEKE